MEWDADRKLDAVGLILAVAVLLSIATLAFGAMAAIDGDVYDGPDVVWSVESINESHTEIEHVEGDTMLSGEFSMTVDGQEHPTPFEGVIRPGDTAVVPASEERQIQLFWESGTGTRDRMYP